MLYLSILLIKTNLITRMQTAREIYQICDIDFLCEINVVFNECLLQSSCRTLRERTLREQKSTGGACARGGVLPLAIVKAQVLVTQ